MAQTHFWDDLVCDVLFYKGWSTRQWRRAFANIFERKAKIIARTICPRPNEVDPGSHQARRHQATEDILRKSYKNPQNLNVKIVKDLKYKKINLKYLIKNKIEKQTERPKKIREFVFPDKNTTDSGMCR